MSSITTLDHVLTAILKNFLTFCFKLLFAEQEKKVKELLILDAQFKKKVAKSERHSQVVQKRQLQESTGQNNVFPVLRSSGEQLYFYVKFSSFDEIVFSRFRILQSVFKLVYWVKR